MMNKRLVQRRTVRSAVTTWMSCLATLLTATSLPAMAGLSLLDFEQQGANGVSGLAAPMALALSPAGEHLYVASSTGHSVTLFVRDPYSGKLTYQASYADGADGISGLKVASDVAVSPDGGRVYATSLFDGTLVTFERSSSGQLTFVDAKRGVDYGVAGLVRPFHVFLSIDGKHLYVASRNGVGQGQDVLAVFARDAQSGALAPVEHYTDGVNGMAGLAASNGFAWSPDGLQLYVTSGASNALTVWTRDGATGKLALLQTITDGVATQSMMTTPFGAVVSADGAHVYVAGSDSDSVAIFARGADGRLSYVAAVRNGDAGVNGLDGPLALAVSGDGGTLYVGANAASAVLVFDRDPATGALTPREHLQDAAPERHLERVSALAAVSSGAAFYALASTSNELSAWGGPAVNLAVSATSQAATTSVGETTEYRLSVGNVGSTAATQVRLQANWATADAELGLAQASAGRIEQTAQTVDVIVPRIDPGANVAVTVPVKFLQEGNVRAGVRGFAAEPDASTADNSATVDVQVVAAVTPPVDNPLPGETLPPDETLPPEDNSPPAIPNSAPRAVADAVSTALDTTVDVLVLFNDVDDDVGDTLSIVADATDSATEAGGAVALVTLDGGIAALRYTPPPGFTGSDRFTYAISDAAGARSAAEVTVNVQAAAGASAAPATPTVPTATRRNNGGGGGASGFGFLCLLAATLSWRRHTADTNARHSVSAVNSDSPSAVPCRPILVSWCCSPAGSRPSTLSPSGAAKSA